MSVHVTTSSSFQQLKLSADLIQAGAVTPVQLHLQNLNEIGPDTHYNDKFGNVQVCAQLLLSKVNSLVGSFITGKSSREETEQQILTVKLALHRHAEKLGIESAHFQPTLNEFDKLLCTVGKNDLKMALEAFSNKGVSSGAGNTNFFFSLTSLRKDADVSADVVKAAQVQCGGGSVVCDLSDVHRFMTTRFPESSVFNHLIADGEYAKSLAAFVVGCTWPEWQKHAVYALHGEVYHCRVFAAKLSISKDKFRDHVAGALMHRANGSAHMAKNAFKLGKTTVELPCWPFPRALADVAKQAVDDMRRACTLRSEKYGTPKGSRSIFYAYQAALRNLAEALDIYSEITTTPQSQSSSLRQRADNLALCDKRLLEAVEGGVSVAECDQKQIDSDLRLAESAVGQVIPRSTGQDIANCSACQKAPSTHLGFSCRCTCLCGACASLQRVQECPACGDFTEFIPG